MPLEAGTYIADLNSNNPVHTDPQSQGDSHIRLIKSTLQATFPNFKDTSGLGGAGALTSTQAAIDNAVAAVTGTVSITTKSPLTLTSGGTAYTNADGGIGLAGTGLWGLYVASNGNIVTSGPLAAAGNLSTAGNLTVAGTTSLGAPGLLVPTGTILMWPTSSAPAGYLLCNGQSTSGFTALAAIVGGAVPNFTGRTPVGVDSGNSLGTGVTAPGTALGEAQHTLANGEIPAHSHPNTLTDPQHTHTSSTNGGTAYATPNPAVPGAGAGYTGNGDGDLWYPLVINPASTGITINNANNTGGGGSHNNMQPSLGIYFIIKT